jgi:hypothetical protein
VGSREFKLTWLVDRAVQRLFEVELPWLGTSLYEVREADAGVVERRVKTLIKLLLLRDPGLERYGKARGPLMRVEWQADEILRSRWKPHNRLRAERNRRRKQ